MRNIDIYFDSGLRGWLKTTAVAEHWRVASWYSVDDLVQDGYICYFKCRDRYTLGPPKPGRQALHPESGLPGPYPNDAQRRHFMSLVQRAFYNHIYTLAMRYPATQEQPMAAVSTVDGEPVSMEELLPPQPEETSALIAVLQAPAEIGDAILKLVNDGIDGSRYLRSRLRVGPDGRITRGRRAIRETTEQHMGRILGDPELPKKTLAYLLS